MGNTGGTCWFLDCYKFRGPTQCIGGACICDSDFCAVEGRCVPEDSLVAASNATRNGVALAEVEANPLVPLWLGSVFLITFRQSAQLSCSHGGPTSHWRAPCWTQTARQRLPRESESGAPYSSIKRIIDV